MLSEVAVPVVSYGVGFKTAHIVCHIPLSGTEGPNRPEVLLVQGNHAVVRPRHSLRNWPQYVLFHYVDGRHASDNSGASSSDSSL